MERYEILLVLPDENPHGFMSIVLALQDAGYHVTTAINSECASEALRTKDFDLVITDQLDVLKKAKEVSPETMVVILSSNYKVTFVITALRLGADDYILKPASLIELRHLAAHCLEQLEIKPRHLQSELHEETSTGNILNILKIMSHDIRGSLLSISATLKLLTRGYYGEINESVGNSLEELLLKTISLTGMTEEYLRRAFSVNGGLETEDETLDFRHDILNPILEELSQELREHCIRVEHRCDGISMKRISIKANRICLKTVFRNLLKNAIKYGDPGGTIGIDLEDHGSFYRWNIYNSGKPIPEECRNKLFSKFTSLGNNGNGGAGGMGLGLYLVKQIIQKYGGEIWYEAQEDGSNFIFTLPSGLAFSTESFLPIKPSQPRLAAVRVAEMGNEARGQEA
jgi:signal transduction histidine kinase